MTGRTGRTPLDPPGRVLVIDDDDSVRLLTVEVLQSLGFSVAFSDTPWCADLIVREKPEVILMDVMMPGLRGDRAVQAFGEVPEFFDRHAVLLHSAQPEAQLRELVARCGATGYHCKDGEIQMLADKITTLVLKLRARRA